MTQDNPAVPGGYAPGSRIAGYLLEEQIGQGGMAVVFRAHDERLDRTVALKILAPALAADEAFRQRFIRESRAAAAVDDPHIIPVFEAGESSGVLFIAMRFVRGGDVRTMVRDLGPLPPGRVAEIVSQVASALDAAHGRGLVHRDVKPANMLLDSRATVGGRPDHVYLSDFGLSKAALQATGLTGTGTFLGTLDYIAPEQIEGKPVDGRADQYALACAAYELITGRPPFQRDDAMAIMYAQLSEPPPPVTGRRPELPFAVDDVFAKALAKAPADRYPSCTDFADALRGAMGIRPYDSGPGQVPSGGHPATQLVGGWPSGGSGPGSGPGPGPGAGSGAGPGSGGGWGQGGTQIAGAGAGAAGAGAGGPGGPPTQIAGSGGDTSPDLTAAHWPGAGPGGGPGGPGGGGYGGGYGGGRPGRRPWWRSPGAIAAVIVLILVLAGGGGYLALHKSSSTITDTTKPISLPGCTSAAASGRTLNVPNSFAVTKSGADPFGVIGSPDGKFAFAVTPTTLEVYGVGPGAALTLKWNYTIALKAATGIAITPDGKYLLVAAANNILVLNIAQAEVGASSINVGTLTVPNITGNGQAVEVLVSKQGKYAFLSLKASNLVAVFNLKQALDSNTFGTTPFVGSIQLGSNPVGMALSPDGRMLYVTSYAKNDSQGTGQGLISVLNVLKAESNTAKSLIAQTEAGCEPARVVASADGRTVWVTARGSNAVLGFDASKLRAGVPHPLVAKVQVGQTPIGVILVNGGRRLIVADTDLHHAGKNADNLGVVNVVAALAGKPALLGYISSGELPRELAVIPGGRYLLVSDNGSAKVQIVDLSRVP